MNIPYQLDYLYSLDKLTNDPASVNHSPLYEPSLIFHRVVASVLPNWHRVLDCIYGIVSCKTRALCRIDAWNFLSLISSWYLPLSPINAIASLIINNLQIFMQILSFTKVIKKLESAQRFLSMLSIFWKSVPNLS